MRAEQTKLHHHCVRLQISVGLPDCGQITSDQDVPSGHNKTKPVPSTASCSCISGLVLKTDACPELKSQEFLFVTAAHYVPFTFSFSLRIIVKKKKKKTVASRAHYLWNKCFIPSLISILENSSQSWDASGKTGLFLKSCFLAVLVQSTPVSCQCFNQLCNDVISNIHMFTAALFWAIKMLPVLETKTQCNSSHIHLCNLQGNGPWLFLLHLCSFRSAKL